MRNLKPTSLGEGWFDWVGTTPGELDPETAEVIESTVLPKDEQQGFFDWLEVTSGRVNPKTGKIAVPTNASKEKREAIRAYNAKKEKEEERKKEESDRALKEAAAYFDKMESESTGQESTRSRSAGSRLQLKSYSTTPKTPASQSRSSPYSLNPNMNGYGSTRLSGSTQVDNGPGIVLWAFLGASAIVALEAFGVTNWSR